MLKQQHPVEGVRLLDPYFVSMMLFEDEEEELEKMVSLKLFANDYLMIPLNTNSDWAGQGDHWTLVVLSTSDLTMHVFDSTGKLIDNVEVLKSALEGLAKRTYNKDVSMKVLHAKNTPKQSNSYDCGIYVIGFAETLLKHLEMGKSLVEDIDWKQTAFRQYRKTIRSSIDKLMLECRKAY